MNRLVIFINLWVGFANAEEVTLDLQNGRNGYLGTQDVTISVDPRIENDNLGGTDFIGIWQFDGIGLIRFDLSAIPRSAVIKNASLKLYCSSVGFAPEEKARAWPVGVYECTHEWKEGTGGVPNQQPRQDGATLKTFNGTDPWPDGKATSVVGELLGTTTHEGDQQRWYEWELKPDVIQAWISGSRPNYGFLVWGKPPGKAVSLASKESTDPDKRPILRLTLSIPNEDAVKLSGLLTSNITWQQFAADCGKKAQEANEARTEQFFEEKYLGRVVNWTGTVFSTNRQQIGSGYVVLVRMDPTESAFNSYDLSLSASESLKDAVLSLNKGQRVSFTARFSRLGGNIVGHQLELLSINPTKAVE